MASTGLFPLLEGAGRSLRKSSGRRSESSGGLQHDRPSVFSVKALSGYLVPVLQGGRAEAPPRPWRTAAIYTALALLTLAVGFPAGMPWPEVAIAPVSLFLLGFMQTLISWEQLLQRRRSADQWIRFKPRLLGPMDVWREQELTSARERRSLARSVLGIVDEINAR